MEAKRAAHTLTELDIQVDEIFCSYLKRSIKSAWVLADEMDQVRRRATVTFRSRNFCAV